MDSNTLKGLRFEHYVEQLFKGCGLRDVERNLLYIRKAGRMIGKRNVAQVDIQVGKKGLNIQLDKMRLFRAPQIYELKYSSGHRLPYNGRASSTGVTNAVDQILRAADITKCDIGGIVTNALFSEDLQEYADKMGVKLYDAKALLILEQYRQNRESKTSRTDLSRIKPSIAARLVTYYVMHMPLPSDRAPKTIYL
ncbi:MAG TPA: hypothetical protein VJI75_00380 [Candidatus Nanoarchaeia archaeon]|nr:hypothetical protein [Candidatus Nanoarchaeia archaeon]